MNVDIYPNFAILKFSLHEFESVLGNGYPEFL